MKRKEQILSPLPKLLSLALAPPIGKTKQEPKEKCNLQVQAQHRKVGLEHSIWHRALLRKDAFLGKCFPDTHKESQKVVCVCL